MSAIGSVPSKMLAPNNAPLISWTFGGPCATSSLMSMLAAPSIGSSPHPSHIRRNLHIICNCNSLGHTIYPSQSEGGLKCHFFSWLMLHGKILTVKRLLMLNPAVPNPHESFDLGPTGDLVFEDGSTMQSAAFTSSTRKMACTYDVVVPSPARYVCL